ncbi:peptidase S54 [Sulfurifustis variabilis]|uniref:Peptidase S54 n=1 Tax=Sulfurifustis variabilis TaxID=1675686 RepID=A0A1B4V4K5_9GAMM|nr:rhomboid family intramembrane serine protease [Sulfurifustis variabilis]BAU47482.1 peptidase S54 [Sulfurifustis variabilis]
MANDTARLGSLPPLTVALIVVSGLLALHSNLGASRAALAPFLFTPPGGDLLAGLRAGEYWRLLTPIFIHFGPLHLLFNMMWLWDLGGLLERRRGVVFLAGFVAAVGIAANLAEYLVSGARIFGGMSGVVYGLLGYFWMQGKYNPRFGYVLHKQVVVTMLAWYVLCWTGLLGPIANWAHTAGLVIGVVWGYLERGGREPAPDAGT